MNVVALGLLLALSAVPFVLLGVAMVVIIRQSKREKTLGKALQLQGRSITGQILKQRVEEVGRGCRCYLTYQYVFEGTTYEYEQRVKVEGFNAVRDGEGVTLLLFPRDPSTPRLVPMKQFQFQ